MPPDRDKELTSTEEAKTKRIVAPAAAALMAKDVGVKVRFVPTDWKTMIAVVVADRYDIVMSGTSTNLSRAKAVGCTMPYTFVGTIPPTHRNKAGNFESWADAIADDQAVIGKD